MPPTSASAPTARRSPSNGSARPWRRRCRSRRRSPALGAALFGVFVVRLSGIYLAMLTLAAAQILYAVAFQWVEVTGGDNGIVGVWPSRWAVGPRAYYYLTLALAARGRRGCCGASSTRRSATRCAPRAIRSARRRHRHRRAPAPLARLHHRRRRGRARRRALRLLARARSTRACSASRPRSMR